MCFSSHNVINKSSQILIFSLALLSSSFLIFTFWENFRSSHLRVHPSAGVPLLKVVLSLISKTSLISDTIFNKYLIIILFLCLSCKLKYSKVNFIYSIKKYLVHFANLSFTPKESWLFILSVSLLQMKCHFSISDSTFSILCPVRPSKDISRLSILTFFWMTLFFPVCSLTKPAFLE